MALLTFARVAAAAALLVGCYSPDLRDCTVTCATAADCAGAQVCSTDHLCAAAVTSCSHTMISPDAPLTSDDAPADAPRDAAVPAVDAPPPIDARSAVSLHLHVDGHGQLVEGTDSCTMDCTYQVSSGVGVSIVAVPAHDQRLDRWTQGPCVGSQSMTCTVTPTTDVTVAVKFHKDD